MTSDLSPEAAPPRATTPEPMNFTHLRELASEARTALQRVGPPSSPEQDRDGLYYPLLFLAEQVEATLRAVLKNAYESVRDENEGAARFLADARAPLAVSPSRASGAPDGTGRGAATPIELATLLDRKRVSGGAVILSQAEACLIQVALEDAEDTGEPSPDSVGLLDEYEEASTASRRVLDPRFKPTPGEVACQQRTAAARAAVDAHLTAAERDAERMRRDVQRAFNTADALANALTQDSDSGDFGRALEERAQAACKLFAQLARLRAALPPAGDTPQ